MSPELEQRVRAVNNSFLKAIAKLPQRVSEKLVCELEKSATRSIDYYLKISRRSEKYPAFTDLRAFIESMATNLAYSIDDIAATVGHPAHVVKATLRKIYSGEPEFSIAPINLPRYTSAGRRHAVDSDGYFKPVTESAQPRTSIPLADLINFAGFKVRTTYGLSKDNLSDEQKADAINSTAILVRASRAKEVRKLFHPIFGDHAFEERDAIFEKLIAGREVELMEQAYSKRRDKIAAHAARSIAQTGILYCSTAVLSETYGRYNERDTLLFELREHSFDNTQIYKYPCLLGVIIGPAESTIEPFNRGHRGEISELLVNFIQNVHLHLGYPVVNYSDSVLGTVQQPYAIYDPATLQKARTEHSH